MKSNLQIARETLEKLNQKLAIAKNGKIIYMSTESGVKGLLKAIEEIQEELRGASMADKIVGKAAALLAIHAGINEVYAETISLNGLKTLEKWKVKVEYETLTPTIMDKSGLKPCPMEEATKNIETPKEAYEKLKSMSSSIMKM
jgi:hypothetical protein